MLLKVAVYTLGCKTNQSESQAMEKLLMDRGFEIVHYSDKADAYIINTCTVTSIADKKSRQIIRKMRRDHPEALIAVCGCMSQLNPSTLKNDLRVDIVTGNRNHVSFVYKLSNILNSKNGGLHNTETKLENLTENGQEWLPAGGLHGRTRALLKVEDGCDNYCSYCIIPYARGGVRSLPMNKAIEEGEELARIGFKEIILTGIEISSYGKDLMGKPDLADLVEKLCLSIPDVRIGLGSLKPSIITEEFCKKIRIYDNLCPHFHLSIQSACDETLARMNRHYSVADIANAISLINLNFPNANITGDIICGFSGESEEEFSKTYTFIKKHGLGGLHVFPYSQRPGTAACQLSDEVTKKQKENRCSEIAKLSLLNRREFLKKQIGLYHNVLLEKPKKENESIGGYTQNKIYLNASGEAKTNQVYRVLVTGISNDELVGEIQN